MSGETYKIVRWFREGDRTRVIKRGLTREEAERHCSDPATHKLDASGEVEWFDGFEVERRRRR